MPLSVHVATSVNVATPAKTSVLGKSSAKLAGDDLDAKVAARTEWASRLSVLPHLTEQVSAILVQVAYQCWKAFHTAAANLNKMIQDGSWEGRVPGHTELVKIFVSKTAWHKNYHPAFSKVQDYPSLLEWLEQGDDAPAGWRVFGVQKDKYTFQDVLDYITCTKPGTQGKRKGGDVVGSSAKKVKKVTNQTSNAGQHCVL
jgi:hypothetical protein